MKAIFTFSSVIIPAVLFWFMLPEPLFEDPLSTVVYDRRGELVGARIGADQQWRFPYPDSLPYKYRQALITSEDRFFQWHPGINPASMIRALFQNIREGKVVSGASTITMQVIRMARKNRPRTLFQKVIESMLTLRLELTESKKEILHIYASNAPFGGNIVGLEAASWRYFSTSPHNLSWAESALLAVLPNAPSMIHPGRNRELLIKKRNRLLLRLYEEGDLDSLTCSLAIQEPIPAAPQPLPDDASHVTDYFMEKHPGEKHFCTLDGAMQIRANLITEIHAGRLSVNQVHNLAGLIVEVETGDVLVYVGNSKYGGINSHGKYVDVVRAPRSTGSILKPILYAGMLDKGLILPGTLVPDVPVRYDGYAPKNYHRGYEGAVPAYQALERSLNVPSVIMLKAFGVDPFLDLLQRLGFSTFTKSPDHYGLTLILGGAEASLWELAGVYTSLARVVNHYYLSEGNYYRTDLHMPRLEVHPGENIPEEPSESHADKRERSMQHGDPNQNALEEGVLSAASIYLTFQSLLEVNRPDDLSSWEFMESSTPIAWKTGTSYGFRDAWAIGITPEYLVAVWAGNADGEGRPGLTGLSSAAPVMFDLFDLLPRTSWFRKPEDELVTAKVCARSGYLAGINCTEVEKVEVTPAGLNSVVCPYHRTIHLSADRRFRVHSGCYPVLKMETASWFVLPPHMEYYYRKKDPLYRSLPPLMANCSGEGENDMEIVYPEQGSQLVIPRLLDGSAGNMVMEAAHRDPGSVLFWHMDDTFIGCTQQVHRLTVQPVPGLHRLTVVDHSGSSLSLTFRVLAAPNE